MATDYITYRTKHLKRMNEFKMNDLAREFQTNEEFIFNSWKSEQKWHKFKKDYLELYAKDPAKTVDQLISKLWNVRAEYELETDRKWEAADPEWSCAC